MKTNIYVITVLLIVLICHLGLPQSRRFKELRREAAAPEEIISLSHTMPFSQALLIFNDLSKKYLGKVIIDPQSRNFAIGIDVNKMHWLDAFEQILTDNNLWYEETADYIKIINSSGEEKEKSKEEKKAEKAFHSREVVISAIFFETNSSKLRQAGMSWDFFRGRDINVGTRLSSADGKTSLFEIDVTPELDFGSVLATFKALESDQIGEIIASPRVSVESGKEGRIQVGSDIAVTIKDFAGNSVTQFFSTGSIIKVKPLVIRYDSLDFISLDLEVERSNTASSGLGLEIKKSSAQTDVLLLDGEETIIGGLYINEESSSRDGIPFLKNLPWWFFGLRYIFGFESKNVIKKELLILIKAELLPTLKQRLVRKTRQWRNLELIRQKKNSIRQEMDGYEKQWNKK